MLSYRSVKIEIENTLHLKNTTTKINTINNSKNDDHWAFNDIYLRL